MTDGALVYSIFHSSPARGRRRLTPRQAAVRRSIAAFSAIV
jgi:hypothetical protein